MQKTKEFEIEGVKYRVTEILAIERMILGAKLNVFEGGLVNGFSGASPEDSVAVTKMMLELGLVVPKFAKEYDFNKHFTEYYHHIPEIIDEIHKINFSKYEEEIKKKFS